MIGYCKVILLGRVYNIKKIEGKSGTPIALFSVGTFEKIKGKEDKAIWHDCVMYGPRAESFATHVKEGMSIFFEGKLDHYEKDGKKKTQINCSNFEFTSSKED
jgi:single-stranded DNA-binding protein